MACDWRPSCSAAHPTTPRCSGHRVERPADDSESLWASLKVTAALFERCALVIGLDSGAAHLAGAVGTPTVRLYGPAPVAKYGPWPRTAPDQRVLTTDQLACVPCGYLEDPPCGARSEPACLLALSVEKVLGAAKACLDTTEN